MIKYLILITGSLMFIINIREILTSKKEFNNILDKEMIILENNKPNISELYPIKIDNEI